MESILLIDCQVRVWYIRDMKRYHYWMDKCYRYVWSNRNGKPLRHMEACGMNMQDVRCCLGMKIVRWKIKRGVLERIDLVVRKGNDR